MKSLYSNDPSHEPETDGTADREISLSTSSVLGIFFGLAVVCAIFFGFGYALGRHTPGPVSAATASAPINAATNTSKPSPNGIFAPSVHSNTPTRAAAAEDQEESDAAPAAVNPVKKTAGGSPITHAAPVTAASAPGVAPTGSFIVQVAAVSHKEDADLLVGALKQRGYSVNVRQEPQDKLLHVQVGPFATHKDADAMRQRLLANGYNAIVK